MERWRRFAAETLGQRVELRPAGHAHGEAEVWRVLVGTETRAYLKRHRVADKWRREHHVLLALGRQLDDRIPPVLAADRGEGLLLLGALPGVLASEISLTQAERRLAHRQAGELRRQLDALTVPPDDPLPLPQALEQRLHAWLGRTTLPPALCRRVVRTFNPACFARVPRRWCHRDLAPYNWLVEGRGEQLRLRVIDFGQARPDAWLVDVLKLWDEPWVRAPGCAAAFFAGYGRPLRPAEHPQLRQLALLHGLATATWGDRHAHPGLSQLGRRVLERALRDAPLLPGVPR